MAIIFGACLGAPSGLCRGLHNALMPHSNVPPDYSSIMRPSRRKIPERSRRQCQRCRRGPIRIISSTTKGATGWAHSPWTRIRPWSAGAPYEAVLTRDACHSSGAVNPRGGPECRAARVGRREALRDRQEHPRPRGVQSVEMPKLGIGVAFDTTRNGGYNISVVNVHDGRVGDITNDRSTTSDRAGHETVNGLIFPPAVRAGASSLKHGLRAARRSQSPGRAVLKHLNLRTKNTSTTSGLTRHRKT